MPHNGHAPNPHGGLGSKRRGVGKAGSTPSQSSGGAVQQSQFFVVAGGKPRVPVGKQPAVAVAQLGAPQLAAGQHISLGNTCRGKGQRQQAGTQNSQHISLHPFHHVHSLLLVELPLNVGH
jgi:hypothetical protein